MQRRLDYLYSSSSKVAGIRRFLFETPCGEFIFFASICLVMGVIYFLALWLGSGVPKTHEWMAICIVLGVIGPPATVLTVAGIGFIAYYCTGFVRDKVRYVDDVDPESGFVNFIKGDSRHYEELSTHSAAEW